MNQLVIIDFPTGKFKVKGTYCIETIKENYKEKSFNLKINIYDSNYDYDSAFPEDQESLIIQEKIQQILPKGSFDLNLTEWSPV